MKHGASEPRCGLWRATLPVLLLLLWAAGAWAQETPPNTPVDSTRPARADTLAGGDSAGHDHPVTPAARPPVRDIGAPLGALAPAQEGSGYDLVMKHDLVWSHYFTAFDVLFDKLPAYPLSQGAPGMVRAFSYAGASPDAISGLFNGRAVGGPAGRGFDLELYPVEFLERLEVLRGARAAVLGSGESLIALNFTQPRYDVEGSYVRLWYAQGENNTSDADISYARNVGNRANFSLGFRRLASDGVLTNVTGANQSTSSWSARGSMRWDPSDNLAFSLTEMFSDGTRGFNGGLTDSSGRFPGQVQVINDSLKERTLRHDITFTTRWYPHSIAREPGDTTAPASIVDSVLRIDGNVYFSYAERELQVPGGSSGNRRAGVADAYNRAGIAGARAGFAIPLERLLLLTANGMLEYGDAGRVRFEGGGLLELPIGNVITLRGGGKFHGYGDDAFATITGEGVIGLGDSLAVRGTFRTTALLNTGRSCALPTLPEVVNRLSDYYTASMMEGALEWRQGTWKVDVEGFLRTAASYCPDVESYTVAGANVHARIPLAFLTLDNNLVGTFTGEEYHGIPRLHGISDLFTNFNLFGGNLELRLGTNIEYMSSRPLVEYMNESGEFVAPKGGVLATIPTFPLWSAYAQGRIGTAYLRVEMYNILDNFFITTYRYPAFRRSINISVNWALID